MALALELMHPAKPVGARSRQPLTSLQFASDPLTQMNPQRMFEWVAMGAPVSNFRQHVMKDF